MTRTHAAIDLSAHSVAARGAARLYPDHLVQLGLDEAYCAGIEHQIASPVPVVQPPIQTHSETHRCRPQSPTPGPRCCKNSFGYRRRSGLVDSVDKISAHDPKLPLEAAPKPHFSPAISASPPPLPRTVPNRLVVPRKTHLFDERKHGLAHGFGAAHGPIGGEPPYGAVTSFTVASELTSQCETSSARAWA